MSAIGNPPPATRGSIPELSFSVQRAEAARHAAVPTLRFVLRIDASGGQPVRSVLLDVQIQIAARQRGYSGAEEDLLAELFGAPERWGTTLRTLPWTRATSVVPPFQGSTEVELPIPCSYDLEVAGARSLAALVEGAVPLEFLFSGSVFFRAAQAALQMIRIPAECEATYQLPVSVWREAIDRHFPDSAWLRLGRERFRALCAYKARHAFTTWDATIDALLGERDDHGR
jgi:hypothetical protein